MTLVVGDDFDTPAALNTNARVGRSQICAKSGQVRVESTLPLTDTNYRTVLRLFVISVHRNRAQKNESEESEEDKGQGGQQPSRLCPRRSTGKGHDEEGGRGMFA